MPVAIEYNRKDSTEEVLINYDFSPVLATGETISSPVFTVTPTTTPALSIGAGSINGSVIQALHSGGLAVTVYKIKCLVTTSIGQKLIVEARLEVD